MVFQCPGPVGWFAVSKGSLTASIVHPRDVFAQVVRYSAAALVFVHNLCEAPHKLCYVTRPFMCSAPRAVMESGDFPTLIWLNAPHNEEGLIR